MLLLRLLQLSPCAAAVLLLRLLQRVAVAMCCSSVAAAIVATCCYDCCNVLLRLLQRAAVTIATCCSSAAPTAVTAVVLRLRLNFYFLFFECLLSSPRVFNLLLYVREREKQGARKNKRQLWNLFWSSSSKLRRFRLILALLVGSGVRRKLPQANSLQ
jgi:hypothetical protein